MLDRLPADILNCICQRLSLEDILRLRLNKQMCRSLEAISYNRVVKLTYIRAEMIPGLISAQKKYGLIYEIKNYTLLELLDLTGITLQNVDIYYADNSKSRKFDCDEFVRIINQYSTKHLSIRNYSCDDWKPCILRVLKGSPLSNLETLKIFTIDLNTLQYCKKLTKLFLTNVTIRHIVGNTDALIGLNIRELHIQADDDKIIGPRFAELIDQLDCLVLDIVILSTARLDQLDAALMLRPRKMDLRISTPYICEYKNYYGISMHLTELNILYSTNTDKVLSSFGSGTSSAKILNFKNVQEMDPEDYIDELEKFSNLEVLRLIDFGNIEYLPRLPKLKKLTLECSKPTLYNHLYSLSSISEELEQLELLQIIYNNRNDPCAPNLFSGLKLKNLCVNMHEPAIFLRPIINSLELLDITCELDDANSLKIILRESKDTMRLVDLAMIIKANGSSFVLSSDMLPNSLLKLKILLEGSPLIATNLLHQRLIDLTISSNVTWVSIDGINIPTLELLKLHGGINSGSFVENIVNYNNIKKLSLYNVSISQLNDIVRTCTLQEIDILKVPMSNDVLEGIVKYQSTANISNLDQQWVMNAIKHERWR